VRRVVGDDEAFLVDRLVMPDSIHGLHGETRFHPRAAAVFERLSARVAAGREDLPKRIYVDRRGARLRPLLNESDITMRLGKLGFVPVRLETLGVADQIRLFRGADAIVAPHGAGLANLGFCRPGCLVLELFMDAYVNWCFRHLAAIGAARYDCVVGRSIDPWIDMPVNVHGLRWLISPDDVAEAAAHLLAQSGG
jgi:capsular polysaccharide biosynthesis protein